MTPGNELRCAGEREAMRLVTRRRRPSPPSALAAVSRTVVAADRSEQALRDLPTMSGPR
jgi:hypothetical protein